MKYCSADKFGARHWTDFLSGYCMVQKSIKYPAKRFCPGFNRLLCGASCFNKPLSANRSQTLILESGMFNSNIWWSFLPGRWAAANLLAFHERSENLAETIDRVTGLRGTNNGDRKTPQWLMAQAENLGDITGLVGNSRDFLQKVSKRHQ